MMADNDRAQSQGPDRDQAQNRDQAQDRDQGPDRDQAQNRDQAQDRDQGQGENEEHDRITRLLDSRIQAFGRFASGVIDEIDNPLTFVRYNLEQVKKGLEDLVLTLEPLIAVQKMGQLAPLLGDGARLLDEKELGALSNAANDASEGIRRLSLVSRSLQPFGATEGELEGEIRLNEIIDSALAIGQAEIKPRANVEKRYDNVPRIEGYTDLLALLFFELLIDFARSVDPAAPTITISTRAEADRAMVKIQRPRSAADEDENNSSSGKNSALEIARRIVQNHHGRLEIDFDKVDGTAVVVSLPLRQPDHKQAGRPRSTAAQPHGPARHCRILVIDDERAVAEAVGRTLDEHHDVVVGNSGADAMFILKKDQAFDLLICDLKMPDGTGMDLHQWITARFPPLAQRMIFITGDPSEPKARAFLDRVPNPVLLKPFRPEQLEVAVREVLMGKSTF